MSGRWRNVTLMDRLEAKYTVAESGCWEWRGAKTGHGYGVISLQGRQTTAHRAMWIARHGDVAAGDTVDHLCRNHGCVNPDHLEAVPHKENVRRWSQMITHCPRGHEYTVENTYLYTDSRGTMRKCRACHRARQATRRDRSRVA